MQRRLINVLSHGSWIDTTLEDLTLEVFSSSADQTAIGTSLTDIPSCTCTLQPGTFQWVVNGYYWSSTAGGGFGCAATFTGTASSQIVSAYVTGTTWPATTIDTTSLATRVGTSTLAPTSQATRLPFQLTGRIVVTATGVWTLQASAAAGTTNIQRGLAGSLLQV